VLIKKGIFPTKKKLLLDYLFLHNLTLIYELI